MAVNFGAKADPASAPTPPTPPAVEASEAKPGVKVKGGSSGELAAIMAKINKESGAKSIMVGSQVPDCTRLPTGVFEFDLATGGGFPDNRMSIVYGPESCLDKDTFVQFEVRDRYGSRQNHKGGTIEKLWHRFHGKTMPGKGHYQRNTTQYSEFFAPSINEDGRIFQNLVVDVVKTGVKPCWRVTTAGGHSIVGTAEHKFFVGHSYMPLSSLVCGQKVYMHTNTPYTCESSPQENYRSYLYVKNHPVAGLKVVEGKYFYKRLLKSRAVIEAHQNELTLEQYITRLNDGKLDGLSFLPRELHVHHVDEDFTNDDISNLLVMSSSEHSRSHALERHNNLRYMAVPDIVESIDFVGERETYDIRMESPCNNYVANNFVVHNSGKTNLAYKAMAMAQRCAINCNKAVFVDLEGTFDPKWAAQFGIDTDELLVAKPSYGEQAVDMVDALVRASDVRVLVLDSLAVLVAAKELDGTVEKADVGTAAMLVKRLSNKLAVALSEEQKRGHSVCVILLNQTRFKIGVMFGDPECVTADTLVNFVDGRSIPMEEVVSKKLVGPVWAFNEATNSFEPRKILSHHINGSAKDGELITLRTGGYDTLNGTMSATVSFTHKFLTASGWKRAGELTKADLLVSRFRTRVNGTTLDFLRGASCGDLTLATRNPATGGHTTEIRIQDSENPTYADWKASKLSAFTFSRIVTASGKVRHVSNASYSLTVFKGEVSGRSPIPLLSNFTWLGFSVWVMDDAHFQESHGRYFLAMGRYRTNPEMRAGISARLNLLGLDHKWKQDKQVVFTVSASKVIASNIAKYVPPCMQYKLPAGYRGRYEEFSLTYSEELVPIFVPIHEIGPSSKRQYRNPTYYDIHVEGLNNYSVGNMDNGFVVHNTMPGGQTVKFNSSLIVRLYGKNKLVKEISSGVPAFKETNVTIKKAKVGITQAAFSYDLCMLAHDGLGIGDTDSFNAVKGYLQAMGELVKDSKSGWNLLGVNYPTLSVLCDTYRAEADFANKLHMMIVKAQSMQLVAPEDKPDGN